MESDSGSPWLPFFSPNGVVLIKDAVSTASLTTLTLTSLSDLAAILRFMFHFVVEVLDKCDYWQNETNSVKKNKNGSL